MRISMVLVIGTLIAGCAGSIPGRPQAPFYVGKESLPVHAEPAASAKVVGRLALHEKVFRSDVDKGYARVRSAQGHVTGWVDNAHLLARLPAAHRTAPAPEATTTTPAPAAVREPDPVEPTPSFTPKPPPIDETVTTDAIETVPSAAPAPTPKPDVPKREPAVFDPF